MDNKNFAFVMFGVLIVALMQLATIVVVGETSKRIERIEQVVAPQDTAAADTPNVTAWELNRENFLKVCEHYGVQHPDIVYAQAQLESGHFTSAIYRERCNCLGLYNSAAKEYYTFTHWSECIKAYKNSVQYKYQGGDYYAFLTALPYAEDDRYAHKVRRLVERERMLQTNLL